MITLSKLHENFRDYLPEWQQSFCESPSYDNLCDKIHKWLTCKEYDMPECALEMAHAKMVFDDLCAADPECVRQKELVQSESEMRMKNERLSRLWDNHLDDVRAER